MTPGRCWIGAGACAAIVTGWAVWMVWLPSSLAAAPPGPRTSALAAITYSMAGLVCHQDPARSFHTGPWPWPVCGRCVGLYGGAAAGAWFAMAAAWGLGRRTGGLRVPLHTVRLGLLAAAVPTAVSWAAEWLGRVPVSALARALTAVPLGAAVAALVVLAVLGLSMPDNRATSGVH